MRDDYENAMIYLYRDISVAVIVIMDIDIAVGEGIPSYIDLFFLKPHRRIYLLIHFYFI